MSMYIVKYDFRGDRAVHAITRLDLQRDHDFVSGLNAETRCGVDVYDVQTVYCEPPTDELCPKCPECFPLENS